MEPEKRGVGLENGKNISQVIKNDICFQFYLLLQFDTTYLL